MSHTIALCAPDNLTQIVLVPEIFGKQFNYPMFTVNDEMFQIINQKPQIIKSGSSTAFIFGTNYATNYLYEGQLFSTLCGFYDVTDLTVSDHNMIVATVDDLPCNQYVQPVAFEWYDLLEKYRKVTPRFLFIGYTSGTALYLHHNSKHEVDSIILDNGVLFDAIGMKNAS